MQGLKKEYVQDFSCNYAEIDKKYLKLAKRSKEFVIQNGFNSYLFYDHKT